MSLTVALLVNPIAGIGGAVALKGSDGVVAEAAARGGRPLAPAKALEFLRALGPADEVGFKFLPGPGMMGEGLLEAWRQGTPAEELPIETSTRREDTLWFLEEVAPHAGLLVFVGGDGTARDVAGAWKGATIAVPGGVKMFSECFAASPQDAARALKTFEPDGPLREAEVADVDEEAYREGRLASRLFATLQVPERASLSCSKCPLTAPATSLARLADAFLDEVRPETTYVFGAGTTLAAIKQAAGLAPTLLGFDVARTDEDGVFEPVARDATEEAVWRAVCADADVRIVVTPTGGQGFILGRGTGSLSPRVLRQAGLGHVRVVAPREKLLTLDALRIDTGDADLDGRFPAHLRVLTGHEQEKVMRLERGAPVVEGGASEGGAVGPANPAAARGRS